MGNEANGISNKVLAACQYQITIGMVNGVDSLSVGVATGILLHGMRERESERRKGNIMRCVDDVKECTQSG